MTVRPWTAFDSVFRYRRPRHDEGRILPGRTLKQVVNRTGGGLDGLARQAVAALLNAGASDSNEFPRSVGYVIERFQVYWDGTEDMSPAEGPPADVRPLPRGQPGGLPGHLGGLTTVE